MTTTLQVRLDPKLKKEAQKIAKSLGLDLSSAIKMFLVQMTVEKGLPFYAGVERHLSPKEARYLAKLSSEAMNSKKTYTSVDAMFRDILGK